MAFPLSPAFAARLWRRVKSAAVWPIGLVIAFEEWGWAPLARCMARLGRLPPVAWLERRIAALPPRLALLAFCVPALVLFPVKLGALWLLGVGRIASGVAVLLLGKIASTAVVARIFALTRPQLMQLPRFARAYLRWLAWKTRVMARLRASPAWRSARAVMRGLARRLRRLRRSRAG